MKTMKPLKHNQLFQRPSAKLTLIANENVEKLKTEPHGYNLANEGLRCLNSRQFYSSRIQAALGD